MSYDHRVAAVSGVLNESIYRETFFGRLSCGLTRIAAANAMLADAIQCRCVLRHVVGLFVDDFPCEGNP